MNDNDRTEGADEAPDAAPQDASGTPAEGVAEPPALEAGTAASSTPEADASSTSDASANPTTSAPPTADAGPVPPSSAQGSTQYQASPAATYTPRRMLESEARNWSMLIHIIAAAAALLSAGTVSWLVPLIIWLIFRERSALIDHHGKQALNLQLTLLIVMIGGVLLGLVTLFLGFFVTIPLMIAYGIYAIVISFVAGVKANNGEYYKIPLMIPFLR